MATISGTNPVSGHWNTAPDRSTVPAIARDVTTSVCSPYTVAAGTAEQAGSVKLSTAKLTVLGTSGVLNTLTIVNATTLDGKLPISVSGPLRQQRLIAAGLPAPWISAAASPLNKAFCS